MTSPGSKANDKDRLKYIIELIEFRSALRQGKRDSEWLKKNSARRLIYMIDMNLTYLYFRPAMERSMTRALSTLPKSPGDDWIAVITSRFLFDGKLPGRGQHPLFIDKAHMEELSDKLMSITEDLLAAARDVPDKKKEMLRKSLDETRRKIDQNRDDIRVLRRVFENDVRKVYADFDLGDFASPKLLHNMLRRKDLIRPVATGPHLIDFDFQSIDQELVEFWNDEITKVRTRTDRRPRNIARDAECLARLQKINEHLISKGAQVRYVLVTADRGILEAVRRNRIKFAEDDPGSITRDLLQYIPLGNIQDIRENFIESDKGTLAIERAIDALFAVSEISPEGLESRIEQMHGIAASLRRALFELEDTDSNGEHNQDKRKIDAMMQHWFYAGLGDSLTKTMETVKEHWLKLMENAVILNQRLIVEHYREWLGDLLNTIDTVSARVRQDLGKKYEKEQLTEASELTRAHMNLVLSSGVTGEWKLSRHWTDRGFGLRLLLPVGKEAAMLSERANRAIAAIKSDQKSEFQSELWSLCQSKRPIAEVTLTGAFVAVQTGLWSAAAELARLSQAHGGTESKDRTDLIGLLARLIAEVSKRGRFMESMGEGNSHSLRMELAGRARSIADLLQEFDKLGHSVETALLHTEFAWNEVMRLMLRPSRNEPEGVYDKATMHAGHAFDIARALGASVDFSGKEVRAIVQARASAALVMTVLHAAYSKHPLPSAAQSLLAPASQYLLNRPVPEDEKPVSLWTFLGDLALFMKNADPSEKIQIPVEFRIRFNILHKDKLSGLRREKAFLKRIIDNLAEPEPTVNA